MSYWHPDSAERGGEAPKPFGPEVRHGLFGSPQSPLWRAFCPASKEAELRTICSGCLTCSGVGGSGPNVVVQAHGSKDKIKKLRTFIRAFDAGRVN